MHACDVALHHCRSTFRVRWANGLFPQPSECASLDACELVSSTVCLCAVQVEMLPVFTDPTALPTAAEIDTELPIGAYNVDIAADYDECLSAACNEAKIAGVTVFTHKSSSGAFDTSTVFRAAANSSLASLRINKVSRVTIPGTAYSFRNPVGRIAGIVAH